MSLRGKHRGIMPVKGYFNRARVFAFLMLTLAVLYFLRWLFTQVL